MTPSHLRAPCASSARRRPTGVAANLSGTEETRLSAQAVSALLPAPGREKLVLAAALLPRRPAAPLHRHPPPRACALARFPVLAHRPLAFLGGRLLFSPTLLTPPPARPQLPPPLRQARRLSLSSSLRAAPRRRRNPPWSSPTTRPRAPGPGSRGRRPSGPGKGRLWEGLSDPLPSLLPGCPVNVGKLKFLTWEEGLGCL